MINGGAKFNFKEGIALGGRSLPARGTMKRTRNCAALSKLNFPSILYRPTPLASKDIPAILLGPVSAFLKFGIPRIFRHSRRPPARSLHNAMGEAWRNNPELSYSFDDISFHPLIPQSLREGAAFVPKSWTRGKHKDITTIKEREKHRKHDPSAFTTHTNLALPPFWDPGSKARMQKLSLDHPLSARQCSGVIGGVVCMTRAPEERRKQRQSFLEGGGPITLPTAKDCFIGHQHRVKANTQMCLVITSSPSIRDEGDACRASRTCPQDSHGSSNMAKP
ncbi:hypothetical protein KM043_002502 [Ampulex compressa]|nr:hypothetical protein KM043_002502 [Ampulex compressa]